MDPETQVAETMDAPAAGAGENLNPQDPGTGGEPAGAPGGAPDSGAADPRARGSENAIPHWRVKEMLAAREREWSQKHSALEQRLKQYDDYQSRMQQAQLAYLRQTGALPEEKPSYVPEEKFNQSLQEMREQFRTEMEDRAMAEQARSEWREIAAKYPHYAGIPGFRDSIFAAWVKQPFRPMDDIATEVVNKWDGLSDHFAKRAAEAQKALEEKNKGAPKVGKSGAGAGAPARTSSEKRESVGDRIKNQLNR